MSVLQEILPWAKDRPDWQRDALRRLVTKDSLNNEDYEELAELCKAAHGLSEKEIKPVLLDETHISGSFSNSAKVNLRSVSHFRGVDALAENQKIEFGSNLTVIYGDNAAGKSGYTRILKSACKARRHEEILGNVLSGSDTRLTKQRLLKYWSLVTHTLLENRLTFKEYDRNTAGNVGQKCMYLNAYGL